MEELELLIRHDERAIFIEKLKDLNISIVKEEKTCFNNGSWITVRLSGLHEAYLLGELFGYATK